MIVWEIIKELFNHQGSGTYLPPRNVQPPPPPPPKRIENNMSEEEKKSIFEMTCCPLCGGKSGFQYIMTMTGLQVQPWKDGNYDGFFEDTKTKHGAYRCQDCNKIIK